MEQTTAVREAMPGAVLPVPAGAAGPPVPAADRVRVRPRYRAILAVDIEASTTRTDPVKAELRRTLYRLLEEAFNRAGIGRRHREEYVDRGDGALVLVRPFDEVPKTLLLHPVVPLLSALLAEYNSAQTITPGGDRRIRLRVVVHAGEVHNDGHGNFGEALDVAFRLLDSAEARSALRRTRAPLALIVSEDIYHSIVRHGYEGIRADSYVPLVRLEVTGRSHQGWVHVAGSAPARVHRRTVRGGRGGREGLPAWRRRLRALSVSGGGPRPPG
jgi:class 3 adenylate cyclase